MAYSKESIDKVFELTREFSNIAGYKNQLYLILVIEIEIYKIL